MAKARSGRVSQMEAVWNIWRQVSRTQTRNRCRGSISWRNDVQGCRHGDTRKIIYRAILKCINEYKYKLSSLSILKTIYIQVTFQAQVPKKFHSCQRGAEHLCQVCAHTWSKDPNRRKRNWGKLWGSWQTYTCNYTLVTLPYHTFFIP